MEHAQNRSCNAMFNMAFFRLFLSSLERAQACQWVVGALLCCDGQLLVEQVPVQYQGVEGLAQ